MKKLICAPTGSRRRSIRARVVSAPLILGVTAGLLLVAGVQPVLAESEKTAVHELETNKESGKAFAGSEACVECHKPQVLKGPHGAATDHRAPNAKHGCESCHGSGKEHAVAQEEGEDDLTVAALRFGKKSAKTAEEQNEACLQCHTNGHTALWQGSTHERRDVKCVDCHDTHSDKERYLKGDSEAELCVECHKDVRSDFRKLSHHPVPEGKMSCSDCHNSHGTVSDKLVNANYVNEKCYECHAEKRGPFLWEHAPVTENCMSCHSPHGSNHETLLTNKAPYLCQSCHSNARHPGTMYAIPGGAPSHNAFVELGNRAFYRSCQNCHSQVHGSNHPSGKALAR